MLYTPSFVAMFLANLCTVSSFGAFFLFPLFITEHGGTEGDIGMIMGSFALASALCRPWVSEMIDRRGRKKSYLAGCLIMTLMPLCYLTFGGELDSFYLPLIVVRIVHGVGLAICFTAIFTFVADLIPPGRLNEGIGIFGTSGLIGLALGPLVAEVVLRRFGFPQFFLLASLLAGSAMLITLLLPEAYSPHRREAGPSFFQVLARRKQLVVALLALLFGFGLAASGNFVAPMAKVRGLPFISLYYLAYSAAAVLVRFGGGRLADRIGEARVLPYALVVTALGLIALILVHGEASFFAAGFVAGAGHGLLFPTLNTLAIRNEPPGARGKITGIFTGGIDTGAFIGAILLGYLGEWGGFDLLFATSGGALLLGLLVLRFSPATRPVHSDSK
ncbi:MAG: MFS transporter [Desulfuromonadaceae bacterium GWC2_58_13]|nr:MAG: MFS transporter [Desulfuromonadaceae bacterium GWC2_58_13]